MDICFKALQMLKTPPAHSRVSEDQSVKGLVGECARGQWPKQKKVSYWRRGSHPSMLWSACDQLKENKGHISSLQVDRAAPPRAPTADGWAIIQCNPFKLSVAHPWINAVSLLQHTKAFAGPCERYIFSSQQNSSSHGASPTSSECLSGSLSTKLLSECLSDRRELMEARL